MGWSTTQLEVEKFFSMASFQTRRQLRLNSWFPISEEAQLYVFSHLFCGTSVLVGKRFPVKES